MSDRNKDREDAEEIHNLVQAINDEQDRSDTATTIIIPDEEQ